MSYVYQTKFLESVAYLVNCMNIEIRRNHSRGKSIYVSCKIPEPFSIGIRYQISFYPMHVRRDGFSSPYIPLGATIVLFPNTCLTVPAMSANAFVLPDVIGAGSNSLSFAIPSVM